MDNQPVPVDRKEAINSIVNQFTMSKMLYSNFLDNIVLTIASLSDSVDLAETVMQEFCDAYEDSTLNLESMYAKFCIMLHREPKE